MKEVLVVGGGGREHALVWKLAQSKTIGRLFVAPGNAGTAQIATNISVDANNLPELLRFAKHRKVGLTVVGPDDTLAAGIVDEFRQSGLKIFGPTKRAAKIEGSKSYAKQLMKTYDIPTAAYEVFSKLEDARQYIKKVKPPK